MNPSWFRTLATAAALLTPTLAPAQFSGDLVLWPKGCEAAGECIIKEALRFKDASGTVWEAKAGLKTDGASIPGVFQPFIGSPFETRFIKAAVIHDHYCDRHVRSWRMTHRVFYDALLDQGVSQAKAKTMYLAVLVGGPKWIRLIAGNACGKNCINAMKSVTGDTGFRTRPADYSLPALAPAMQEVLTQLEANPNALTLEQIEERAQQLMPGDFYFANGDTLVVTGEDAIQ
ncbi:DUF1353 domain-containing protein [Delftia sp. CH05]|uniref:DUF1353 domain-containing protein n=1 Tax=Delftia sp. CH05 TaxID=2692194 RepID=UPI00135E5131|nr:DUF1353 domain-containing protein [Delftia sp. CH05]MXN32768.1 DUF1353 domain-containing protein [Delftia sp. CH05]